MISTKWPLMAVVGEPVTEEQADDILIRTADWWMPFANDKEYLHQVQAVAAEFGYPPDVPHGEDRLPTFMDRLKWGETVGMLSNIEYLRTHRIFNSNGWCDWDGTIGCKYGIGKWPSTGELTEQWTVIAEAFPFLTLTAQVFDEPRNGLEDWPLCGEWRIAGGIATYVDDASVEIEPPAERVREMFDERGVSLDRLRSALARAAAVTR